MQKGNHLKLARFYFLLGSVWLLICAALAGFDSADKCLSIRFLLPIAAMYFVLGGGCWMRREWARKASVVVGVLMLISPPIGTILGLFFLPLVQWQDAEPAHLSLPG